MNRKRITQILMAKDMLGFDLARSGRARINRLWDQEPARFTAWASEVHEWVMAARARTGLTAAQRFLLVRRELLRK